MRLIACPNCHTQYDVTDVVEKTVDCRCGTAIENRILEAVDAAIHRCGSCGAQVEAEAVGCDYCGSDIVRDERELSLICPECYGRNAENARFCAGCGVGFDPETVVVEGIELPCTDCGVLMPPRQIGGIAINECPGCNGVWVPEGKFDYLVDRAIEARKNADPGDARIADPRVKGSNPYRQRVKYRKCPACDAHMQRKNFRKSSGVIIDTCNRHGTWLDADELEQIAGFILSGGRPQAQRNLEDLEARDVRRVEDVAFGQTLRHSFVPMRESNKTDVVSSVLDIFVSLLD